MPLSLSPAPRGAARALPPALVWSAIALGSTAIAIGSQWSGVSPLLVASLAAVVGLAILQGPIRWAALIPMLMIPPPFHHLPPHEVGLLAVTGLLVVEGLMHRAPWLSRVDSVEIAAALLLGWAIFTGLWCDNEIWFLYNARKMGVGLLAVWAAHRLGAHVSRDDLTLGICLGAVGIAGATVVHAIGTGWPQTMHSVSRNDATDIGWGRSNYITAVLVLMAPTALRVALRDPRPIARVLGWAVLPLVAIVAAISGSRGGALLILLMTLLVVAGARLRRRQLGLALPLMLALLVVGPGASFLLARFTNPVEFASVAIRLKYFGIGWTRFVDHFPFGMGLGQEVFYPDELAGSDPHNYLLTIGTEIGLPGLILWGAVIVAIWRRSAALMRLPGSGFDGMALRITLVIAVANSLFEPTLFGLHYHFLFYWIIGVYLGLARPPGSATPPAAVPPRVPR